MLCPKDKATNQVYGHVRLNPRRSGILPVQENNCRLVFAVGARRAPIRVVNEYPLHGRCRSRGSHAAYNLP